MTTQKEKSMSIEYEQAMCKCIGKEMEGCTLKYEQWLSLKKAFVLGIVISRDNGAICNINS